VRRQVLLGQPVKIGREQIVDADQPGVRGLGDDHLVGPGRVGEEHAPVLDVNLEPRVRHRVVVVRLEDAVGDEHRRLDLHEVHRR